MMVDNRGNATSYSNDSGFIVPKLAEDVIYRKAHEPRPPKPTGLDWDALTPTCTGCTQKSGQIDGTGLCPTCRGEKAVNLIQANVTTTGRGNYLELDDHDVAHRFTAPTQTPQDEATTPPTRASGSQTAAHPTPRPAAPTVRAKVHRIGTHDISIVLHSTGAAIDQVHVAGLLADLLHALNPQTPAVATSTAAAGTKSEGRTRVGKPARPSDAPRARRAMGKAPGERALSARNINLPEARRLYVDEQLTCPQIAQQLGSTPAGVRRALKADGVTMRDDRATNSGGRNQKTYDTALVDAVRRLYLDEHLTIAQVAERLYTTPKVVGTVMRRHDIPSRPDAFTSEGHPHRDNAGALKAQIAALGVTSLQIKTWALHQGLMERVTRGVPKQAVVDAYATAHPTTPSTTTTEGDTAA